MTAEDRMNLAALQRTDAYVSAILERASQVALYSFDATKSKWQKTEVEGSLFVYSRSHTDKYGFTIMNRRNMTNKSELLSDRTELQVNEPYVLYRTELGILGIWFFDREDCQRIGKKLTDLVTDISTVKTSSTVKNRAATPNDKEPDRSVRSSSSTKSIDILQMLSRAQNVYKSNVVTDVKVVSVETDADRKVSRAGSTVTGGDSKIGRAGGLVTDTDGHQVFRPVPVKPTVAPVGEINSQGNTSMDIRALFRGAGDQGGQSSVSPQPKINPPMVFTRSVSLNETNPRPEGPVSLHPEENSVSDMLALLMKSTTPATTTTKTGRTVSTGGDISGPPPPPPFQTPIDQRDQLKYLLGIQTGGQSSGEKPPSRPSHRCAGVIEDHAIIDSRISPMLKDAPWPHPIHGSQSDTNLTDFFSSNQTGHRFSEAPYHTPPPDTDLLTMRTCSVVDPNGRGGQDGRRPDEPRKRTTPPSGVKLTGVKSETATTRETVGTTIPISTLMQPTISPPQTNKVPRRPNALLTNILAPNIVTTPQVVDSAPSMGPSQSPPPLRNNTLLPLLTPDMIEVKPCPSPSAVVGQFDPLGPTGGGDPFPDQALSSAASFGCPHPDVVDSVATPGNDPRHRRSSDPIVLSMSDVKQSLLYLIENDQQFMNTLYKAYLKTAENNAAPFQCHSLEQNN